ncbi:DNA transposition protein [Xanthobacter sp. DSM 24535]|uniref:DNA transposition protein n=1 Tax=Roseixanthobacter psychrophilus TaxID=3119917 RepID=UPI00372B8AC0
MSRRRAAPTGQMDLLRDWQPSNPVVAFPAEQVRGASIAVSISKAVSASLRACGRPRTDVARLMSEYLDEAVTENMLNAYAAEARGEHIINLVRFIALIHVTRDRRLLELVAAQFEWAVIERRYLPAIAMAEQIEARAKLDRDIDASRRALKETGVIR